MNDPKVVLQAHSLRTQVTREALLHGSNPPRSRGELARAVWGSALLAVVIAMIVAITTTIIRVLHHTGH